MDLFWIAIDAGAGFVVGLVAFLCFVDRAEIEALKRFPSD